MVGRIYSGAERYGLAYNIFRRVCELSPKRYEAWNNVGMCLTALTQHLEARKCFFRANDLAPNKPEVLANIALSYLDESDPIKAEEWSQKALKVSPDHAGAHSTLGFAQLAQGKWETGWKHYGYTLGGKYRKIVSYGDEPAWDGSPDQRLVIYGEQGLGDEIMYASCINEAIAISKSVTIDCDERLEGLFKRSFPNAEVHGTRRSEQVDWIKEYDASVPIGRLPEFFRTKASDFPRVPYIKPDYDRVLQWRALFDSFDNPVIGICWTGGSKHNHPHRRTIDLHDFEPFFGKDVVIVSLQYKDSEIIPRIMNFPRATRTQDYDDTAGLVAALDHVVGIHTSVHHLAGAMGVPATILVPDKCSWAYAGDMPWYGSAIHRKKAGETWKACIGRLDVESICRFRFQRSSGVLRVLPLDIDARQRTSGFHPAASAQSFGLQRKAH